MNNKQISLTFLILMMVNIFGCSQKKEDKAFTIFNEGVTLSLDAAKQAESGNIYQQREFKEGIHWFEQANKLDTPMAANYRELGLCKINLGQISEGKADLEKAFEMDKSSEIKEITILDLVDVGHLAFEYGDGYEAEGDKEKGLSYKRFSLGVLITAFNIDEKNKDIAKTISEYAEKIGDTTTMMKYKEFVAK